MNNNLPKCKLSDFINIKHGFAFKGEFFRDFETENYLLTPGNFAIGGGFKSDKFKYYDGVVPADYVLNQDDLVVTMTDLSKEADTLGYSALIPKINGKKILHNQRIGLVQFKNNEVDKSFLYFLLRSKNYRHHVVSTATGTTVKHTSPTKIISYEFHRPPLDIQISIGKALLLLERKITLNTKTKETLEQLAQAIFKSWFIDFDPVKAKAKLKSKLETEGGDLDAGLTEIAEKLGLSKDVLALFPDEFEETELGLIPKGWAFKPLYETAEYVNGSAFKATDFSDNKEGLPIIKIAELKQGISAGTQFTLNEVKSKYFIDNGDVLYSWSGSPETSLEVFKWHGGKGWLNQHIFKLNFNSNEQKHFTYFLLKQIKPLLISIAKQKQTTGLGHITVADMKRIKIPYPDAKVLRQFSSTIGPIYNRSSTLIEESNNLAQLRDTLLPKLLSGEITIESATDLVKSAA